MRAMRRSKKVGCLLFAMVEKAMPMRPAEAEFEKPWALVRETTFVSGATRPATETVS